jgi:hypothetical protein
MKSSREKVFCAQMQRKMDALPPALWQMKVQRELFSWLLNEKANPSFPFYREHKATFFHLDLQERKEAQYLLELATWKALCIAASSIGNGVRDFTGWSAWQTEGWKALKASKRDSNEIGVIVKSVLPFLGTSLDAVGDLDIDAVRDEENDDEAYVGRMFYPSHFADYMLTDTLPDGEVNHSSVLMWGHSEMECDMCDILVGNGLEALEHQSDAEHVRRMQIIIDFQKCPIKMWCANIQNRLESSREREAPWTLEVFSKLYWFLLGYQSWSDDQVNARKDEIIHLLDTHERHEAMILLRLAVWKYACLLNPTSIQEASVKDKDYIAWADWGSQGWKRRKASTPRNSVEIDTIVKCVQPFLTEDRVV